MSRLYLVKEIKGDRYLLTDLDIVRHKQLLKKRQQPDDKSPYPTDTWKTDIWVKSKQKLIKNKTYSGSFLNIGSIDELPEFIRG
jgi:hypothetical protein